MLRDVKVSVIIPVYNCERYVERCVRSVMTQTYNNIEIICVDDGSLDCSGCILDMLAGEDARIHVIHQNNMGVSAARNAGLDIATGDIITFVDSDDAVESDMYETLLPFFLDSTVDIVHCGYTRIYLNGSQKTVNGTELLLTQNRYEAVRYLLNGRLFVGSLGNKMYQSKLFTNIRLDEHLAISEDILANAELFSIAQNIVFYDVGKYLTYERADSATKITKSLKKQEDSVKAAEKMHLLYKGTPAQAEAEARLISSWIGLYRWYVIYSAKSSKDARNELTFKIDAAMAECQVSSKQRINYFLLKYLPFFYRHMYKVYDKIRVKNWDVLQ